MFPKILVKLCFIIDVKLGYKEVFPVSSPEVFFFLAYWYVELKGPQHGWVPVKKVLE